MPMVFMIVNQPEWRKHEEEETWDWFKTFCVTDYLSKKTGRALHGTRTAWLLWNSCADTRHLHRASDHSFGPVKRLVSGCLLNWVLVGLRAPIECYPSVSAGAPFHHKAPYL